MDPGTRGGQLRVRIWVLPLVVSLLVVGSVMPPVVRADESSSEALLAEVRRHDDPQRFLDAVAELRRRGGADGALLDDALDRLAAKARRDGARLARRLEAYAPRAAEGRTTTKLRRAWMDAAAHARAWIFDEEAFPVPEQALITGPMQGYQEAKKRGDAAARAYTRLAKVLDRELGRLLRLRPDKARSLLDEHAEAEASLRRIERARALATEADAAPTVSRLALDLLALRGGAFAEAAALFDAEDDAWTRLCLFYAYTRTVDDANAADGKRLSKQAHVGLAALNAHRVSLGISSLRYSAKLGRMATEHAEEMMRLGYFSHRSPMPERETKEMRAALVGYEGRVVECITGARGPESAIEFWKFDGGHHRDMVDPRWAEGGFSERGNMVYDGGSGEPGTAPVVHFQLPAE